MKQFSQGYFLVFLVVVSGILLYTRLYYCHIPFERDEGEYAYAGSLLLHGHLPYREAYNMKFPGAYFMYACLMKLGGGHIETIRIGVVLQLLLTALGIAAITYRFNKSISAAALSSVVFLALNNTMAGEGLMANAEHFVNLFMVWGIFFLVLFIQQKQGLANLFASGLLLGASVIMKQHGYVVCIFSVICLLLVIMGQPVRPALRALATFLAAMALPVCLLLAWLFANGLWPKFYFLTIQYARAYINITRGSPRRAILVIFNSAIPLYTIVLAATLILLLSLRRKDAWFYTGWVAFSFGACCIGFYFRLHYFILLYPALAAITGFGYYKAVSKFNTVTVNLVVITAFLSFFVLYRNEQFPRDPMTVFNGHYPEQFFADMPAVARHINTLIPPGDKLSLYSNEPELYFYSGHVAATGYLYTYPLFEQQPYATRMTDEFIQQVQQNPSNLFVFQGGYIQADNDSVYKAFTNWWSQYSKNFYLSGIYCSTPSTTEVYMAPGELKKDSSWVHRSHFEFWMRKK